MDFCIYFLCLCVQNDRVAIHEVMEQQTVTIAKAGMHASLNARCSVVAAANPVYGQYDRSRRPQENIGLPDSLLSRFDLLFIVLDQIDPVFDRRLSEHVIKSHQYRRPGTSMEPEPLNLSSSSISMSAESNSDDFAMDGESQKDTVVWQRGGRGSEGRSSDGKTEDVLTKAFLRKYLHFAKSQIKPVLSDAAMDSISAAFAGMRAKQTSKNLPVTARSLETIIRLSSAHAKVRLSNSVDDEDVDVAMELMNFVMFHEVGSSEFVNSGGAKITSEIGIRKSKRQQDDGTSNDDDDDLETIEATASSKRARIDFEESLEVDPDSARFKRVQSTISKMGQARGTDQTIAVTELQVRLNSEIGEAHYSTEEICAVLMELERKNKVSAISRFLCD